MKNSTSATLVLCMLLFFFFPPLLCRADEEAEKAVLGRGVESIEDIFRDTKVMFVGEDLYTVSIASRREEPIRRAPAAVSVIAGEELKRYMTLKEALDSVPGFFSDRNEVKNRIYLRGIPDSFLVMMDGVPFSNETSTRDYPREWDLSLNYIEKIEIVRGPGSALWGADAFSGIVNLVTKKGKDVQGTIAGVEVGTFDTQRYKLLTGYNKHDTDVLLSANYTATKGFQHNLPGLNDRKRDHGADFYGKLRFKEDLEISGRYSRYTNYSQYEVNSLLSYLYSLLSPGPAVTAPGQPFGERLGEQVKTFLNTPRRSFHGEEYTPFSFIQATYNKDIGSSSNLLLTGYAEYFEGYEESFWYASKVNNWQYGFEGKYDFNFLKDHLMTLGSSIKYNDASRKKWRLSFCSSPSLTIIPSFTTYLYSFYFQDKYKITDNLELTGGVRFDEPEDYESSVSPRIGISWSFWDDFNLKLLYGRAFRTPSRFLVVNEANLDTEKIESFEVELGYQYGKTVSVKGSFFYNKLKDIIEEVAFGIVRNRGRDHVKGIEFSATYQPFNRLSLYTDITYLFKNMDDLRSEFTISGPDLSEPLQLSFESSLKSPRGMFHWGLKYKLLDYLTANLHFSYFMKRELGENPFYPRTGSLSPYFLMDVNLFFKPLFDDRMEMSLKIRNLTKETYTSRGRYSIIDGAGRGFFFSLQYKF